MSGYRFLDAVSCIAYCLAAVLLGSSVYLAVFSTYRPACAIQDAFVIGFVMVIWLGNRSLRKP